MIINQKNNKDNKGSKTIQRRRRPTLHPYRREEPCQSVGQNHGPYTGAERKRFRRDHIATMPIERSTIKIMILYIH